MFVFTFYFVLYRERQIDGPDEEDDIEFHETCDLPKEKEPVFKSTCKLTFQATLDQKQMFTGKEIHDSRLLEINPIKRKEFDSLGLLTIDRMISRSSSLTNTYSFLHLTLQEFLSAVHLNLVSYTYKLPLSQFRRLCNCYP